MRQRGAHELTDGRVVDNRPVDQQAAVAMIGVLAEADVGDDQRAWHLALDGANGRLHRRLRIVRRRSHIVLVLGQAEQQHARHAVGLRRGGFLHRFIDREVEDAWHRPDLAAHALALADEEREYEHVR